MNFLKTTAASAIVLTMVGTAASAASWDFAQDAQDFFADPENGYEGTFDQVYGGSSEVGGITLTASAIEHPSDDPLASDPVAFMDSYSSGRPGGLGVCSSGFDGEISDCATGNPDADNKSDDNLVFPEILVLSFSDRVWLEELTINDGKHFPENGPILVGSDALPGILVGPGGDIPHPGFVTLQVVNGVVQNTLSAGFSNVFYFTSAGSASGEEIYLETMTANVPLPAAGWLLLAGLGGLAATKRRKVA